MDRDFIGERLYDVFCWRYTVGIPAVVQAHGNQAHTLYTCIHLHHCPTQLILI